MSQRRRHSAQFKFKVALEAAKGTRTLNQLASEYELHVSQISEWKRRLLDEGDGIFKSSTTCRQQREQEALHADLYEQIGRLKMQLEWLKKKVTG